MQDNNKTSQPYVYICKNGKEIKLSNSAAKPVKISNEKQDWIKALNHSYAVLSNKEELLKINEGAWIVKFSSLADNALLDDGWEKICQGIEE